VLETLADRVLQLHHRVVSVEGKQLPDVPVDLPLARLEALQLINEVVLYVYPVQLVVPHLFNQLLSRPHI
jgi:hypothetical protein